MTKFNSDIQVWVGDLAEYNNGNLVGDWFMLPMDLEEMMKEVLLEGNEEYYIGDVDSELYSIIKEMGLRELNEFAEKLESLQENEQIALCGLMEHCIDLEEALEILENGSYSIYNNCKDMSDVAYEWYDMTGQLSEITKHISEYYIDFEGIGRDMEINGTFIQLDNDMYLEIYN
jgi:antirestriction protein